MSGRIWVVEINAGTRANPDWQFSRWGYSRQGARKAQKSYPIQTRVVQYVRQGGAR